MFITKDTHSTIGLNLLETKETIRSEFKSVLDQIAKLRPTAGQVEKFLSFEAL